MSEMDGVCKSGSLKENVILRGILHSVTKTNHFAEMMGLEKLL